MRIAGDSDMLADVLRHLAENARDAMPEGGTLTIRSTRRRPMRGARHEAGGSAPRGLFARLCVTDTGTVGMNAETRARLFEPFFSTRGLGRVRASALRRFRGIVRQHGGSIDVDSAPGKGAAFTILIPLAAPRERQAASAPGGHGP